MAKKQSKETSKPKQVTPRLTREQAKRTEARIRQLLCPPNSDQETDEEIEERVVRDVRKERVVKKCTADSAHLTRGPWSGFCFCRVEKINDENIWQK